MRPQSSLVGIDQTAFAKHRQKMLDLCLLHPELERDIVDCWQQPVVLRRQAPEIEQRFDGLAWQALDLGVIDQIVIKAKPSAHSEFLDLPAAALFLRDREEPERV